MNKVMLNYIIVSSTDHVALSIDVQRSLSLGWQPIGGVSFDGKQYLQAMVKYKESEE